MLFDFFKIFGSIIITLLIAWIQKYMSTRNTALLGVIIPIISCVIMGLLVWLKNVPLSTELVIACAVIIILELFLWIDGRREYRFKSLNKMKAKDIG